MDIYEKEFDIDLAEISTMIESNANFALYSLENGNQSDLSYILESFNASKIKEIFQKIIDVIKKIGEKIYQAASTKLTQMEMQNRLADLKEQLAARRLLGTKIASEYNVRYKSTEKYMKDYKNYINDLVKYSKKLFYNDFDEPGKYIDQMNEYLAKLDKKYEDLLECSEKEIMAHDVLSNLEMSEKEIKNLKKNIAQMNGDSERAIRELDNLSRDYLSVLTSIDKTSKREKKKAENKIKRIQMLEKAGQKIATVSKKAVKVIAFHPIEIGLLFSRKFAIIYNDKEYERVKSGIEKTIRNEKEGRKKEIDDIKNRTFKKHTGDD